MATQPTHAVLSDADGTAPPMPCTFSIDDPAGLHEGTGLLDAWASAFEMAHEICERIRQRRAARLAKEAEGASVPAGRETSVV